MGNGKSQPAASQVELNPVHRNQRHNMTKPMILIIAISKNQERLIQRMRRERD